MAKSDGYNDGYAEYKFQLNIKLNDEDLKDIEQINKDFFENGAGNSVIGRILIRKGIAFFKGLGK